MEKKVMSFDEFVFESYKMIQEGLSSFEDIKSLMSKVLDNQGKKALAAIEDMAKMNSISPTELLKSMARGLDKIFSILDKGEIKDVKTIKTDIKAIEVNPVINGMAFTKNLDLPQTYFFHKRDESILVDFINAINLTNIRLKSNEILRVFDMNNKFRKNEDGYISGTGLDTQYVISDTSPSLEVVKINSLKNPEPYVKTTGVKTKAIKYRDGKKEKIISFVLAQYVIKEIRTGEGDPIDKNKIHTREIKKSEGPGVFQSIEIKDDGVLFDQGKSNLKDEGKENIQLALGRFNTIYSIEIIGGASQEGDERTNKRLCKERAEEVKNYLKSFIHGVEIKVSEKMNIQPKEAKDDRIKWRKVTLNVNGTPLIPDTLISDTGTKQETINYNASKELHGDKVTLAQILMEYQVKIEQ